MIIVYIVSALLVAGLLALLAGYLHEQKLERMLKQGEIEEMPAIVQPPTECCGQHEICEKESLLAAVSKDIEYYNDEELDRYRGTDAADYSEEATDEFREVFYTMRDDEVAGWVRSLQLRGINLPDALKDEVFLIVGERRTEHT